jgi:hypothetical protein
MADIKILNLDEILAEQTERVVIWQGVRYPVAGMTGEAYLKFLSKRKALDKAQKDNDETAQWEQNLAIIGIVVPGLADKRTELLALRLPVLTQLTQYIMDEFNEASGASGATKGGGGGADQPGESTLPG